MHCQVSISRALVCQPDKHGINRAGGGDGFWGAQALLIPGRTLEYLATLPQDQIYRRDSYPHASDIWLGLLLTTGKAPWRCYGTVAPSFLKHAGQISQVSPGFTLDGYGRETPNFIGDLGLGAREAWRLVKKSEERRRAVMVSEEL